MGSEFQMNHPMTVFTLLEFFVCLLGLLKLSFFPGTIAKVIFFEWADTEQIITAGPYEKNGQQLGSNP